jgi:hypothetical protein
LSLHQLQIANDVGCDHVLFDYGCLGLDDSFSALTRGDELNTSIFVLFQVEKVGDASVGEKGRHFDLLNDAARPVKVRANGDGHSVVDQGCQFIIPLSVPSMVLDGAAWDECLRNRQHLTLVLSLPGYELEAILVALGLSIAESVPVVDESLGEIDQIVPYRDPLAISFSLIWHAQGVRAEIGYLSFAETFYPFSRKFFSDYFPLGRLSF